MDKVAFVAFLGLVGILTTIIFEVMEWKKTTWILAFATSIICVALPILTAPDAGKMIEDYSRVFQPDIAKSVVRTMFLFMLLGGVCGIVTCAVSGIRWYFAPPTEPKRVTSATDLVRQWEKYHKIDLARTRSTLIKKYEKNRSD